MCVGARREEEAARRREEEEAAAEGLRGAATATGAAAAATEQADGDGATIARAVGATLYSIELRVFIGFGFTLT